MKANRQKSVEGAPPERQQDHLYQQVAWQITQLIQSGTLRPGDRVPSVRKLMRQKSVSAATVVQAFQSLEGRGLIQARPRSGFYVRAPRWTPAPVPDLYRPAEGARKLNMAGLVMEVVSALGQPGLVNLGAAVPPPDLLPSRELHRALAGATRRQPALANTLDPSLGLRALRIEIARQLLEAGCACSPEDIVVTNGATEALHLCLRAVTRPGDTVAIESPTYFGILQLLETLGLRACEIPTCPFQGICLDELAARLPRARVKACLFMTNFSNPLGSCMPEARKQALVELLGRRGVPLIEDDTYGSVCLEGGRPGVAKAFDREGGVLLCGSLGKTLAPGYRIGWAVPGRFKEQVHQLKHTCAIGNAMVTQLAIAEFLANGAYERHLRRLQGAYLQQREHMCTSVARYFPDGTRATRPGGGQVLWIELPGGVDALALHRRALAEGISIAPGPIFSARQHHRNCVRLNYANPWSVGLETAVRKLGALAARPGNR